jgi:hypothetical protein
VRGPAVQSERILSPIKEDIMNAFRCGGSLVLIGAAVTLASSAARAQCQTWQPGHSPMGVDGAAFALCTFDDGSGPAIFVGGTFTTAGGDAAKNIARWNGFVWTPLNGGANNTVRSMVVFDDGSGPALYVAGDFTSVDGMSANHIARWSGTRWSTLSVGTDGTVDALTIFDDGSGPALYAGGSFGNAGGNSASNVAKWNGSAWSSVGSGTDSSVFALTVFDDGSGAALYAGGGFVNAGGNGAAHIAKWNGSAWSSLGAGTDDVVFALEPFDDGSGPALYAGGIFANAGGSAAAHVARWNGSAWSPLRGGFNNTVYALGTFDDGSGLALYASGDFHIASPPGNFISKWTGSSWTPLGTGTESTPHALLAFDDGNGPALFAAGSMLGAGLISSRGIVKWDGAGWAGVGGGTDHKIFALAAFDDGSGRALYAGGEFSSIGAVHADRIAKWNGTHWLPLGSGMNNRVRALAVFDDGSGPALYAGGSFTTAGGNSANRIAKWNGSSWSPLGSGIGTNGEVFALAAFDDGTGNALYAGGDFSNAGGNPAHTIAKWNGSTWSSIGTGASGGFQPYVFALTAFDDGTGNALYVGGGFTSFSGVGASGIARWDGTTWSTVGGGLNGGAFAMAAFDDGSGRALFVGGGFSTAGGNPASSIARWDGTAWSALGSGMGGGGVEGLAAYDDGSGAGARLVAIGDFLTAGGNSAHEIASWDGATWSALAVGLNSNGNALCVFDAGLGGGPDLFAGGDFSKAGGIGSGHLAQWDGCGRPGVPMCFGDGTAGTCPCSNFGLFGRGCNNSAATGGALLVSSGWASLAFDSLKLTSIGELASAFSVFLQGTTEIAPVSFGDGLRCAGGNLKRLYTKPASGGTVTAPQSGDLSISARSAALGNVIGVATTRVYQVYYRDPSMTFCPSPAGNTWNVSGGLKIEWLP